MSITREKLDRPLSSPEPIVVLTEGDIRSLVALDADALNAIEEAFARLAEGRADVPPIVGLFVPERRGEIDVKAAYVHGLPSLAVKIASGFFDNARDGLPNSSGLMIVLSTRTGMPQAVLLDNGYLTEVRTGLAGAAAAKYLAPREVRTLGIIGAGTQGRYQARAMQLVRSFERVLVHDHSSDSAEAYVRDMPAMLGVVVEAASAERVVRESQVVVTCTPSHSPIVRAEWLHPGLHITAMGGDTADKQELEATVLGRADRLACDLRRQCVERGEFRHAIESGVLSPDVAVTELGELTSGRRPGRQRPDEITVCTLTGVGVQDTAIALLAYGRASARGLGFRF
jgi:ornithine cyclodeaminase